MVLFEVEYVRRFLLGLCTSCLVLLRLEPHLHDGSIADLRQVVWEEELTPANSKQLQTKKLYILHEAQT